MQKIKIIVLNFGLFVASSCSIFQSKYVEIETEDGECYDEYYGKIIQNKVVEIKDSNKNLLMFTMIDTEETEKESEPESESSFYTIKLKSKSINYELKFDSDKQKSIFIEKDDYEIYIMTYNQSHDFIKKIGTIELKRGEKREIEIGISKQTPCESYIVTKKVLRSELRKNKTVN